MYLCRFSLQCFHPWSAVAVSASSLFVGSSPSNVPVRGVYLVTILLDGNRVDNSLSNPGNPADETARRKEEIRKTHYTSAEDRRRTP